MLDRTLLAWSTPEPGVPALSRLPNQPTSDSTVHRVSSVASNLLCGGVA